MMQTDYGKIFIIYVFLTFIITLFAGVILTYKNYEIDKLTKENKKLKQVVTDYKWQIEQVPYVIEAWCSGE